MLGVSYSSALHQVCHFDTVRRCSAVAGLEPLDHRYSLSNVLMASIVSVGDGESFSCLLQPQQGPVCAVTGGAGCFQGVQRMLFWVVLRSACHSAEGKSSMPRSRCFV